MDNVTRMGSLGRLHYNISIRGQLRRAPLRSLRSRTHVTSLTSCILAAKAALVCVPLFTIIRAGSLGSCPLLLRSERRCHRAETGATGKARGVGGAALAISVPTFAENANSVSAGSNDTDAATRRRSGVMYRTRPSRRLLETLSH